MHTSPVGIERKSERGSALVLAVLILVLLTGISVARLSMTEAEVRMSLASVHSKQAFCLAEAGLEDGRITLYNANRGRPFEELLDLAAGDNGILDFDPDEVHRSYDAAGDPVALSGFGDDVPIIWMKRLELSAGVDGWYSAFLTNDPTEAGEIADSNDRVMLTGVGMGPDRSFRIVQTMIEHQVLVPPWPPALLTLPGPTPTFEGGQSAAMTYSGTDCSGTGDPSVLRPTVGVFGSEQREAVLEGVSTRRDAYVSGTLTGADTIVDLTDPSSPLVTAGTDPVWTDCMGLRRLMASVRGAADVRCVGSLCPELSGSERVVFVEGDFDAHDGRGLLAVTGQLTVQINWDWDGMVLVIGKGIVQRSGGGSGHVSGAIVVANIAGPDQILFTDDDCSTGTDGFDSATFETSGGGHSVMSYCQAQVDTVEVPLPYKTFGFRER